MLIEKLGQYFVAVEDPRCSGKIEHRLIEVLVIAVCAVIACCHFPKLASTDCQSGLQRLCA